MNKACARCQKVVYPIEELKCLDKIWHKTCFKCTECGMTLNMRTYKGFNKSPYCEAHIPKAKATTIVDTPELKRIAENTKIQSNVKYHEDFEKAKGKFTQVADDPETLRIKQNTKIISNVAYHGDLEKKAAMERQRETAESADNLEESEYFSETLAAEQFSQYAPTVNTAPSTTKTTTIPEQLSPPLPPQQQQQQQQHQNSQHHLYQSQLQSRADSAQQQHHHMVQYQQQQTAMPTAQVHHQQHNTAAIIPSSQAAQATQSYSNQHNHMQHQQQHQQQQQQQPQQQYQHYQQPQALRQQQQQQHQQHQTQHQQQQQPIKQASHLYPSGTTTIQQQNYARQSQPQPHQQQQQLIHASSQYQQNMNNSNTNNSNSNSDGTNNYTQLRSAILQNSHHPTGGNNPMGRDMMKSSPTSAVYAYDSYENSYARPTTTASMVAYNNGNSSNNSNNNNSISYQMHVQPTSQEQQHIQHIQQQQNQHQQHQQQQQRYMSNNPQLLYSSNVYNNSTNQQGLPTTSHSNGVTVAAAAIGGNGSGNNFNTSNITSNNIGKIADYDPLTDGPRQMPNTARQSTTLIYSSDSRGSVNNAHAKQTRIGSVSDIDPANEIYGSSAGENDVATNNYQQQQQQQQQQKAAQQYQLPKLNVHGGPKICKIVYRALYDYEAQDHDEVSFREGDIIFEMDSIDSGWMTGRVERTGKVGMLPANYVERALI